MFVSQLLSWFGAIKGWNQCAFEMVESGLPSAVSLSSAPTMCESMCRGVESPEFGGRHFAADHRACHDDRDHDESVNGHVVDTCPGLQEAN